MEINLKSWLQAARPAAQINLALPLILGQLLAYKLAWVFRWDLALLLALYSLAMHLYIVFWNWFRLGLADFLEDLGIPVYRCHTGTLVKHFVRGGEVSTLSVLLTTLLDLLRSSLCFEEVA